MEQWEYRTLKLCLQTWRHGPEKYEDYVVTYADGTRLEGLNMVMSRYLDDGGWELVSMVPTGFRTVSTGYIADTLTAVFRRKVVS